MGAAGRPPFPLGQSGALPRPTATGAFRRYRATGCSITW